MKVRGERECTDCGARWSYYDTGSVVCPECGSLRSVGTDERRLHTASPVALDLGDARAAVGTEPVETVAKLAADAATSFVRKYGFIHGGELQSLEGTFLAATELRYAGRELARSMRIADDEERYLLTLLDGAETGDRPSPEAVPASLTAVRGLTATSAVADYRRDVRRYLDEHPHEEARRLLGQVEDHRTRIEALDGDVPPAEADALVEAARAVGRALVRDDATLSPASERLRELRSNSS